MLQRNIELHPLKPFLPLNAKILMLGSFPPKVERWSMEFFYPNFINDMWRIVGLIFYNNKEHFVEGRRFDRQRIVDFCQMRGIALYDTATKVVRLKDNASDKFLEVVEPTDIGALLSELPECCAVVTTGEKATALVAQYFGCNPPAVGGRVDVCWHSRQLRFWRMPSTSRAYPLALESKAAFYRELFNVELGQL